MNFSQNCSRWIDNKIAMVSLSNIWRFPHYNFPSNHSSLRLVDTLVDIIFGSYRHITLHFKLQFPLHYRFPLFWQISFYATEFTSETTFYYNNLRYVTVIQDIIHYGVFTIFYIYIYIYIHTQWRIYNILRIHTIVYIHIQIRINIHIHIYTQWMQWHSSWIVQLQWPGNRIHYYNKQVIPTLYCRYYSPSTYSRKGKLNRHNCIHNIHISRYCQFLLYRSSDRHLFRLAHFFFRQPFRVSFDIWP